MKYQRRATLLGLGTSGVVLQACVTTNEASSLDVHVQDIVSHL